MCQHASSGCPALSSPAERMLMSYERTGWVDDEPARLTGRLEIRPAAELGPIIGIPEELRSLSMRHGPEIRVLDFGLP